jgi:hypothetical protein
MKFKVQPYETRAEQIFRITKAALRGTGLPLNKFASRFAERVLQTIPAEQRVKDFYEARGTIESAVMAEKRNVQIVSRYLSGEVPFPCDFEEIWIDCLPDPYRKDLDLELQKRRGFLGARQVDLTPAQHLARYADFLTDIGAVTTAMAPILADGAMSVGDAPHCLQASAAITKAIADLVSLQAQIQALMSPASEPAPRFGLVSA